MHCPKMLAIHNFSRNVGQEARGLRCWLFLRAGCGGLWQSASGRSRSAGRLLGRRIGGLGRDDKQSRGIFLSGCLIVMTSFLLLGARSRILGIVSQSSPCKY